MTSLYGTVVFLQSYYKGLWAVENVKPYYEPLIGPTVELQRHLVWSNFPIPGKKFPPKGIRTKSKIMDFEHGPIVAASTITDKRQVLRNTVDPDLGAHVLQAALDSSNGV